MTERTLPTPGPWCWTHIGEKTNGFVVGVAVDENDQPFSGYIPDEYIEEICHCAPVVETEGAVCNYADATLIAAAGTAAHEAREMGFDPIGAVEALPELLRALEMSNRSLIGERDCFYDSVSTSDGSVPDEEERAELEAMDALITQNRAALTRARKESDDV